MTRRRLVALVSAAVLFTLGLAAVAVLLVVTRTEYGHEQIRRRLIQPLAEAGIHGSVYIGRLGGNLLDSVTVDTVAIRDKQGELFLSTGRLTIKFDPRDFWDRRIHIRFARVEHPYVHVVERQNGEWNIREILGGSAASPPKNAATRNWGSYVVLESVRARNSTFLLTMPWHVDDTLHGAKRDSATKFNLARADHIIRRNATGFARTYAWKNAYALVSHARLADPDSDRFGREIAVDTLNADELDPPFAFRNARGTVRQLGDSVWFEAAHFDLPGSTGSGRGKVVWGSGLPIRYDIAVRGDSVSLNDVNWVYPTLPRTGGGSMLLTIKNDPKALEVVNFKLTKMDVHSTRSHVVGNMSFGVGAPLLLVRDVDLKADPVDFDLLRTLSGKPFPVDWRGQLFGTVKGRGGPLTHFYVDDARGLWRDTHVPGAESRFAGRGELDIFEPAVTAFHGFKVDVASLDLRSIEYLFPSFPRLRGFMSGAATLDSSWLDVRFSNAQIIYHDGLGEPSHLSGSGRVTWGEPYMLYDVALNAQPLSLTMLSRSYPGLPFRGLVSGPIRAKGTSPDLEIATSLQGASGSVSFEGRVDVDSVGGYGAHGQGQFSGLNLAALLERASIPAGTFSGHYVADLAGPTASDIRGHADLELERTTFDSVRIYPSRATVRFADGRMYIDSLRLRTAAATMTAKGALGLPKGPSDSVVVSVSLDSLGGLRRYLGTTLSRASASGAIIAEDSLTGALSFTSVVRGRLDSLEASGKLTATDLFFRGLESAELTGTFHVRNILNGPSGLLTFHADSVRLAGVALDTIGGTLAAADLQHVGFSLGAARSGRSGTAAAARGEVSVTVGGQSVRLDSLGVDIGQSSWQLAGPSRLTTDSTGVFLDSLVLRNRDSGFVALSGLAPTAGAVAAQLRAGHIPLADLAALGQWPRALVGQVNLDARAGGTKARPELSLRASLDSVRSGSLHLERVESAGEYRDGRFTASLDIFHNGQTALRATALLPMDVTLFSVDMSRDSLRRFSIRADSADLGIIQTFAQQSVKGAAGRMLANVDISGKWGAPLEYSGRVAIDNGQIGLPALGIGLVDLHADAALLNNTLLIRDISATSRCPTSRDCRPNNRIAVAGSIAHIDSAPLRTYDLRLGARDFHAIDKRTRAKLDISTPDSLRVTGTGNAVALTGRLRIDRGQLFLPDPALAGKQLLDVESDTAGFGGGIAGVGNANSLLARFGLKSVAVGVTLGDEVKLESRQADVNLAGSVSVGMQRSSTVARRLDEPQYALTVDGVLNANNGTYTLDLGLAQRDFTVTQGTVRFDGSTNPDIDIAAIYKVKRYQRPDIGVIVHVKGPLQPGPTVDFTSDQNYEISPSDLVSYLISGDPGFDFAANPLAARTVATFLAPTLSSKLASSLRQSLGSWVDLVQFQGASAADTPGGAASGLNYWQKSSLDFFYGASLAGQAHFGNNIFFSLSTGLCSLSPESRSQAVSPLESLGGRLEYRFRPDLSFQTGREPPAAARYCGAGPLLGTAPTPSNWSLSLLKTWRF